MAKGDGDVGSIRLHVHNRDRFFYRSGPAPGKQTLEIPGVPGITLPATGEWSVLDVAALGLPEGSITLTLSDKGTGWGEWSAIAVRELRACH